VVPAQSSFTDWVVGQCPVQGPRVAVDSSGTLLHTWADASSGAYRVYLTRSDDGAASWGDEQALTPGGEAPQVDPEIAIDADDQVWIVYQQRGDGPSEVIQSSDGGGTFGAPRVLQTPVGVLLEPQAATGPGGTFVAGSSAEREIWILSLDAL
jgi:hypothetical protein